jgi:hypothetical protein
MKSDELLMNVILRSELGRTRDVPTSTWHFLVRRHCAILVEVGDLHWQGRENMLAPCGIDNCSM